jgi:hypothetical protein
MYQKVQDDILGYPLSRPLDTMDDKTEAKPYLL